MQRKKLNLGHPDFAKEVELMPFQMKPDILPPKGFASTGMLSSGFISGLERAKATFPIFGGTSPAETETPPAAPKEEPATPSSEEPHSGGDSAKPEPDVEGMSPQEIAELLKNVGELTNQVSKLTTENNTYKSKEQQAERAQQTREQQLEADLTEAQQTIAKMDAVIRHTAVVNAIQGAKDMEFHNARHVMNELVMDAFDLDVDLDNGTATVSGIEPELKRVAKEFPWLVSKDKTQTPANAPTHPRPRGSGTPPVGGGSPDKVTKRADLINKYPVIAHGRAG